ncbi:MAG: hypothetical protein ACREKK_10960 [Candidatus Methylomirabilales bacterium]
MAEQAKPTEGRRRREPGAGNSLHRPGEILVWLVTGGGTLLGWVAEKALDLPAVPEAGGDEETCILLRLPVMLHQVPAGDGRGGVGLVQLYAPLPVDELLVDRVNVIGHTFQPPDSDLARVHAEAWRQREGGARVLVLPAAPGGLTH